MLSPWSINPNFCAKDANWLVWPGYGKSSENPWSVHVCQLVSLAQKSGLIYLYKAYHCTYFAQLVIGLSKYCYAL